MAVTPFSRVLKALKGLSRHRWTPLIGFGVASLLLGWLLVTWRGTAPVEEETRDAVLYLTVLAIGALSYALIATSRDDPRIVLAMPVVLGYSVSWALIPIASLVRSVELIATSIGLGAITTLIALFLWLSTWGKTPLDLIPPILVMACQGTSPSEEVPRPLVVESRHSYQDWAVLARRLRRQRLVESVRVGDDHVSIRVGRVFIPGLPYGLGPFMLLFGHTIIRIDTTGAATVDVDPRVYRLLERPGPYSAYCRNLVDYLFRS